MKTFQERLEDPRPMIYDGGFGSELFTGGIDLTNSALANDLHPDTVIDIHFSYIEAGADIIGTNTFVASPLHLKMAEKKGTEIGKIAGLAMEHAKAAVEKSDREIYIAGSIGPSPGAIEADAGGVDFGIPNVAVRDAHERVVNALVEGGADFFVSKRCFPPRRLQLQLMWPGKRGCRLL